MLYNEFVTQIKKWKKLGITNVYMSPAAWNELIEDAGDRLSPTDGFIEHEGIEMSKTT